MNTKMSEIEKVNQFKGCVLKWREDPKTGWKLVIDELTPTCKESLVKTSNQLGPHSKKYLAKRLETSNPKVKKALEEMGLF